MPLKNYGTLDSLPTDIEDSTNVRTPVLCWLPTPGIDNKHQYTWATLCVCVLKCAKSDSVSRNWVIWDASETNITPFSHTPLGSHPIQQLNAVKTLVKWYWSMLEFPFGPSAFSILYWVFRPCSDLSIGYAR